MNLPEANSVSDINNNNLSVEDFNKGKRERVMELKSNIPIDKMDGDMETRK